MNALEAVLLDVVGPLCAEVVQLRLQVTDLTRRLTGDVGASAVATALRDAETECTRLSRENEVLRAEIDRLKKRRRR